MALNNDDKDFIISAITTAVTQSEKRIKKQIDTVTKRVDEMGSQLSEMQDGVITLLGDDHKRFEDHEKRIRALETN